MNQSKNPLVPETNIKLTKLELIKIVESLVQRIAELKEQYPHLENFDPNKVIERQDLIWYRNNIKTAPNPEHQKELQRRASIPPIKRPLPPEEITIYPERDGIEIYIEFIKYEIFKESQQMWLPDFWVGDHAVKIWVKGAETKEVGKIRVKINKIVEEWANRLRE